MYTHQDLVNRPTLLKLSVMSLALLLTYACGGDPTGGGGAGYSGPGGGSYGGGRQVRGSGGQGSGGQGSGEQAKPKIAKEARELFQLAGQEAAAKRYDDAISHYQEAYEQDQNLTLALYNIGYLHELQGNEEDARRFYQLAGQAKFGEGWVNLGLMALKQGNQAEAERYFNEAIAVDKHNGRAHLNLARFDKARGALNEARKHVRGALMENSRNIEAYDILAQIYHDQKRYRLALLVTNSGLTLEGDQSDLLTTQGVIQIKTDDINGAVRSFEEAIKSSKNFAARLNLGLLTFGYRDYERSYQLLTDAVQLKPKHVGAKLSLAVAARALKRYDEARRGYQEVLTLSPDHPGALFNLTVLDQDYTEVKPNDFDQRTRLTKSAIAQYQRVLSLSRDKALSAKVKQRIEDAKIILESIEEEKQTAADEAAEAAEQGQGDQDQGQGEP